MTTPAEPVVFPHSPFVPFDPTVSVYDPTNRPFAVPTEYHGWQVETLAWKRSAYLHGNLNPTPTYRISGPGALKFLKDNCVNSFQKFSIGGSKHAVMCNEQGNIMAHGMLLRTGEQEFISYWLAPYITYRLQTGDYDATGEDLTGRVFLFQLAGPRSLQILETAAGEDLRDIRFLRHRTARIAGTEVNIIRVGMAGSLAYEIHGPIEAAYPVNDAVFTAGQAFGIERLGMRSYMCQHTENGFPQCFYHFPLAWPQDPDFANWVDAIGAPTPRIGFRHKLRGSLGPDPELRYTSPIALGWKNIVKFDHDFPGRSALEAEAAAPRRTMVTLEWNSDDVADVFASQFRDEDPYPLMEIPNHYPNAIGDPEHNLHLWADQVLAGDQLVGISSGRTYTNFYRRMISLASIDTAHAALGSKLVVLWGEPGTRQKRIRATVARFPYFDEDRNETVDVTTLPPVHPGTSFQSST
jgi:glycine cleavage system aminomethyltransferase T